MKRTVGALIRVFERMRRAPTVSVVIPFYNCPYVDQAIQSALNQSYRNLEVIVVDDGSDAYREKIDPYLDKLVYIRQENGGTAAALNTGIQAAKGAYIAWLSSDDYFLPGKLSAQMYHMRRHRAHAGFTNYHFIDQWREVLIPWCGRRFSPDITELYESFLQGNPVNGSTVMVHRSVFEKLGYFNPQLRYTHDYDFWFRMLLNGFPLLYLDKVLTHYRSHEESGTRKFQAQIREEMAVIESRYRPCLQHYLNRHQRGRNP